MKIISIFKLAWFSRRIVKSYHQGRYAEPIDIAEQACAHARQLGEKSSVYAASLDNLALLYHLTDRYTDAEPLLIQAMGIRREVLGEEHQSYATSLNNLASLYEATGRYADAEPLLIQAMGILRKVLGEEHQNYASSLNNLAALYQDMGRYADAEPLYTRAMDIRREVLGEKSPDYATSLNGLALLYQDMGRYTDAELLYTKALEIYRKALGEEHPDYAISLNNLALLYQSMGRYIDAEPLYIKAMEIRREVLGEEHQSYATSLNNLAGLYQDMGRYTDAESLCIKAMEILREVLGAEHPTYGTSLSSMATLYHAMGRYSDAELLYTRAMEIWREALGAEHPDYAISLNNLAELYRDMGRYTDAEPLYTRAMEIWREELGAEHPDYATNLNNLAELYKAMGRYADAEPLYRRAMEIQRAVLGEEHPNYAGSLNNLAVLYAATDRADEALKLMEEAAVVDDRMIGQVFAISSESQKMAYLRMIGGNTDAFLSLVYGYLSHDPEAVRSTMDLALRRKCLVAEAMAIQLEMALGERYPELQSKFQELHTLKTQIAHKTWAGPGPEGPAQHLQLLKQWSAQKEQLEAELARQIPEMSMELKLREADRQAVASALPDGYALVEFVRFHLYDFQAVPAKGEAQWKPARYLAFVMPAGEPGNVRMADLGEAEALDTRIKEFRESIERDGRERETRTGQSYHGPFGGMDSYQLREAVLDPLAGILAGCRKLLIAPDGALNLLPLEALPDGNGEWLIGEYYISYLSTGRDVLRFTAESTAQPAEALVVADPDYDLGGDSAPSSGSSERSWRVSQDLRGDRVKAFSQLPGAREEGRRIASMLGVQPVMGVEALESRVKSASSPSPSILHLATHGFFLPDQEQDAQKLSPGGMDTGDNLLARLSLPGVENPLLRSGLAFAGANTFLEGGALPSEAEDGHLTSEDVSGMGLLETSLAVLSGCGTGLGPVLVREGVMGLRRTFVLAGAKAVVMSLWSVPDIATAILMEKLYENLLQKSMGRAAALRDAQIWLRGVTVGEIRDSWLSDEVIQRISGGDEDDKHELQNLSYQPDWHRPFASVVFWGAFICQGDIRPLPTFT